MGGTEGAWGEQRRNGHRITGGGTAHISNPPQRRRLCHYTLGVCDFRRSYIRPCPYSPKGIRPSERPEGQNRYVSRLYTAKRIELPQPLSQLVKVAVCEGGRFETVPARLRVCLTTILIIPERAYFTLKGQGAEPSADRKQFLCRLKASSLLA